MVSGGGKGLNEGRRTASRSIRIAAEEGFKFPQRYILGKPSIAVHQEVQVAWYSLTEDKEWRKRSSMSHTDTVTIAVRGVSCKCRPEEK